MPACQAGSQFVPFLWRFLIWPDRDVNPRPTAWEADTLTTKPSRRGRLINTFTYNSFQNTPHTVNQRNQTSGCIYFSYFLRDVFLTYFVSIKYQWDFLMGKPCVHVSSFRGLVTADGKPTYTEPVVIIVMYSNQPGGRVSEAWRVAPFETRNYGNSHRVGLA